MRVFDFIRDVGNDSAEYKFRLAPNWRGTGSIREGVPDQDRVLAFRARRQHRHRSADQLLQSPNVFDRGCRQVGPGARAGGAIGPALRGFVNWLDFSLGRGPGWNVIVGFAAAPVSGADLDFFKPVEHVELGQRDAVYPAGLDRLAHRYRIEPTAASPPSGHHSEFTAAVAQH